MFSFYVSQLPFVIVVIQDVFNLEGLDTEIASELQCNATTHFYGDKGRNVKHCKVFSLEKENIMNVFCEVQRGVFLTCDKP